MNRLEIVRAKVDSVLESIGRQSDRRCGYVHLYGVAALCALLATKRGIDSELCATAGMLHDISSYETGDPKDHAERSASRASELLAETCLYSESEMAAVSEAIRMHSSKNTVDGPLCEVLKDADVLQHYLYNPLLREGWGSDARLTKVLMELKIERLPS
jgi:uncharacterized protein